MNQEKLIEFKNSVIESTERVVSDYKNKVSDTYYLYSETNLPKNFSDSEERYPKDPRVSGTILFFDRSSDYVESKAAKESFGQEYQDWAKKCVLFEEDVTIIVNKCFEAEKVMLSVIDNLAKPYSMLVALYDSDLISGKIKDKNLAKTIRDKLFGFPIESRIEELIRNFRNTMSGYINSIFDRGGSYGYERVFGADRASKYKNKQDYINSLDSMTLELQEILSKEAQQEEALSLCGFESKEEFAESIVFYANEIFPIIKFDSSNFSDSYTFDYKYKYIFRNNLRGFGLFSSPIIIDGESLKEVCSDFKKSRHVSISASHEDVFGAIERSHKSDPSIPLHEDHFEEGFSDRKSFGHNFNLIYSEEDISNLDFDSDDEEKLKAAEKFNSQIEKITDSILDKAIVHEGEHPRLSEKWDYHIEHHNLGSSYNRSYEHEYDNRYSLVSSLLLQSERRFFKKIKELMGEVLEKRISKLKDYIEKNVSKKYFFFNETLSEETILKSIEDSFLKDNPQKNSYGNVTSKSTIDNIFGSENVVGYSSNYYIEKLFLVNFESYLEDKIKESILSGNHKINLKEEVDSFDSEISNSLDSLSLKFLKAQRVYGSNGNFKDLSSASKFAKGLDRVGLSILSFYTYISGASDFEIYKNIMENYNLHRIEEEEFSNFEKVKNSAIEAMKLDPVIFSHKEPISLTDSATLAGNLAIESIILSQSRISDSLKGNSFFSRNSFYGSSGFKNLKNVPNGYKIGTEKSIVRIYKSDESRKTEFFNLIKNNSREEFSLYIENDVFLKIFEYVKDFESRIYINNGKLLYSLYKGIYDFYHTDTSDGIEISMAKNLLDYFNDNFSEDEFIGGVFYSELNELEYSDLKGEDRAFFRDTRRSLKNAMSNNSFKTACFSEDAVNSIVSWSNNISAPFANTKNNLDISAGKISKEKLISAIEDLSDNKIIFNPDANSFCMYRFFEINDDLTVQSPLEETPIILNEELNRNSGFIKIIENENSDYFIENGSFNYFKQKKEFEDKCSKNIVHGEERSTPSRNIIKSLNIQHFVNKFSDEKSKDKIFKNIEAFNSSMKILIKDFINAEERYFTSDSRKFSDFLKFEEYKELALCTINNSDIAFRNRSHSVNERNINLSLITSDKIIKMFSSDQFNNKLFVFIFILSAKNEYDNSRKLASFLKNIFDKQTSLNLFNVFDSTSYFNRAESPRGYIDNEVLFKASPLVTGSKQDRIIKINNLYNVFHSYAGMPNDSLGFSISRFTDFEFPEKKESASDYLSEVESYDAFKVSNLNNIDNLINSKYLNKLNLNIVLEAVRFFYSVRNDFFQRKQSRLIVDDVVNGEDSEFTLSSYFDKVKENMEEEDSYIFSKPEAFDNVLDFLNFLDIDLKNLASQQNILILKRIRMGKAAINIFAEGSIGERFNDLIPENGSKKPELFSFNFSFELPESPGEIYRFETLKDLDPYHFFVGADTNCCQVLGGVGEAAAIDSYINPYAGVLVLYRNDVLMSQSYFHWQKEDNILILDNVESNYSNLEPAYAALGIYCTEKGLFSKVLCGKGYSGIEVSSFSTSTDKHKPRHFEYEDQYTDYTMGDSMDLSQYKKDVSYSVLSSAIDEAKAESQEELSFEQLFNKFKLNFNNFSRDFSKNKRDIFNINHKLKSLDSVYEDIEKEGDLFLSKYEKVKKFGINKSDLKNFFLSQLKSEKEEALDIISKRQEDSNLKRKVLDKVKNMAYGSDKESFTKEMEEFLVGLKSKTILLIERKNYTLDRLIESVEFSGINFKELEENVGIEKLIKIFKARRRNSSTSMIKQIDSIGEESKNILINFAKNKNYYFETFVEINKLRQEVSSQEKLLNLIDEEMALIDEMIKVSRNTNRNALMKLARFFLSINMNSKMIKVASMAY